MKKLLILLVIPVIAFCDGGFRLQSLYSVPSHYSGSFSFMQGTETGVGIIHAKTYDDYMTGLFIEDGFDFPIGHGFGTRFSMKTGIGYMSQRERLIRWADLEVGWYYRWFMLSANYTLDNFYVGFSFFYFG